jgi:hypothetical protein
MKVVCVRLTSGEEIIGKFVEGHFKNTNLLNDQDWDATGTIVLEKVLGVSVQQVGPKQLAIAFMPFAIAGNDKQSHVINLDNCAVSVYPPATNIESDYISQTSGIQLAKPSNMI